MVDAAAFTEHGEAVSRAFERAGGFDVVVLAIGVLGAQEGVDADPATACEVMQINFVGAGSLMLQCLWRLRENRHGTLVVLSSVAAERPRAGNAIYGAAKAGLDALAQGLADATAQSGVRVLGRSAWVRQDSDDRGPTFGSVRDHAGGGCAGNRPGPRRPFAHDLGALASALCLCRTAASTTTPLPEAPAMRTRLLAVDAAIAVALAIAVLIISPGLAVTAILAVSCYSCVP